MLRGFKRGRVEGNVSVCVVIVWKLSVVGWDIFRLVAGWGVVKAGGSTYT